MVCSTVDLSMTADIDIPLSQWGPIVQGDNAENEPERYSLPTLDASQRAAVAKAKKYASEQSVKAVLLKQTIVHRSQQAKEAQLTIQRQQAVALMCRVYCGSIHFEVKQETIKQIFLPFGPIRGVSMSFDPITQRHKGFAFIEYEVPESATLALEQLQNVQLNSRSLKVGRPSNLPAAFSIVDEITQEATAYNRVFVASVHADLNDEDIYTVFSAFGPIKSCYLVKDPTTPNRHRGYGYIEYETKKAAEDAIASMNMFDLGGLHLRVGKCVTPPHLQANIAAAVMPKSELPSDAAVALAQVQAKISQMDAEMPAKATPSPGMATPTGPNGIGTNSLNASPVSTGTAAVEASASAGTKPALPSKVPFRPASASVGPAGVAANEAAGAPGVAVRPGGGPPTRPAVAPAGGAGPPFTQAPRPRTGLGPPPHAMMTLYGHSPAAGMPPYSGMGAPPAAGYGHPGYGPSGYGAPGYGPLPPPMHPMAGAVPPPPPGPVPPAAPVPPAVPPPAGAPCPPPPPPPPPSSSSNDLVPRVMVLRNMVGCTEVDERLEGEVTEECCQYGEVDRVIIYQEKQGEHKDAEVIVKIFVEFRRPESVDLACKSLNGRFFGGRVVKAESYNMQLYRSDDLSG